MSEHPARPAVARDLLPLVGLAVAPSLPAIPAVVSLLVAVWLTSRPARREWITVTTLVVVAVAALVTERIADVRRVDTVERQVMAIATRYEAFWSDLRRLADATAASLSGTDAPRSEPDGREVLFAHLHSVLEESARHDGDRGATLMVVDADGEAVAWAGPGFLDEPDPASVPRGGSAAWASFGSVTLLEVRALDESRRPWRFLVGQSFTTDALPARLGGGRSVRARWTVVERRHRAAVPGVETRIVEVEGAPSLVLATASLRTASVAGRGREIALGAVALALIALAAMRGFGMVLLSGTRVAASHSRFGIGALGASGLLAAGAALGLPAWLIGALIGGALAAAAALGLGGRWRRPLLPVLFGVVAFGAPLLAAGAVSRFHRPIDLGHALAGGDVWTVLHVALWLVTFGALVAARSEGEAKAGARRGLVATMVTLGVAAAMHDVTAIALPLVLLSGVAAGLWVWRSGSRLQVGSVALLGLVAALGAATGWETGYRATLRRHVEEHLLSAVAPPLERELESTWQEVDGYFRNLDLLDLTPRQPTGLNWSDVAYVVWRQSPLVRKDALSAVAVLRPEGDPVSFSFGLPLTEEALLDPEPVRWERLELPYWRESLIQGEVDLESGQRTVGRVRYWLLPRPGFRLGEIERGELVAGLLRGGPSAAGPAEGLPSTVEYALYRPDGEPLHTPWREDPSLPEDLDIGDESLVETPDGTAWAYSRLGLDGIEVLYLSKLSAAEALERIGIHALATLLLVMAAAVVVVLLTLPRAPFRRAVGRMLRSYSKRLLLMYAVLVLVPLLLLTTVLFQVMEERLQRDQLQAGQVAIDSAQHVLGEFMLTLEPGLSLETQLEDSLLVWLSRVVQHEINLYWGSSINASSKRELFSAGLLPERIPGEIYADLALEGHRLASRVARAGERSYLELYAPLTIPGVEPSAHQFFLSMPLLAQQEEAAEELRDLRRQAVLVTAVLFIVAMAVGNRLARNFTRPIHELVAGTRRIAAGATSLDMRPAESELATVVEAVDDMARRIAEGRRRLVREKQVVERIVDTITSGVVSVDADGRVMLCNRAASELLPLEVGVSLVERLRSREDLQPVAEFAASSEGGLRETTVRLLRDTEERELRLVWVPVPGEGVPSALLVIEDATEVLRAERLQAWAEMARIIAHEVKNPLTPIRLSTEHMRQVYREDGQEFSEVFERCSENILRQVEELRRIAEEFSTYSRIPRLDATAGDLGAAMWELAEVYRTAPPPGVEVRYEGPRQGAEARFDARLVTRAVRNLVENAIRAVEDGGSVVLRLEAAADGYRLSVLDDGPGVPAEMIGRIFEPYFSTRDSGTGLGLPIAQRIAEEHGGSIEARNRVEGGLEVVMRIPG